MTDQEKLKCLLDYNPKTGIFHWKVKNKGNICCGDIAGTIGDRGYIRIDVLGKQYPAHRLAWLYMTGVWPEKQIDHKNLINGDNRFENLREATASENKCNSGVRSDNSSGYKGVHKLGNRWAARCSAKGKRTYLGLYETPELAFEAYKAFAIKHHGEFFRER